MRQVTPPYRDIPIVLMLVHTLKHTVCNAKEQASVRSVGDTGVISIGHERAAAAWYAHWLYGRALRGHWTHNAEFARAARWTWRRAWADSITHEKARAR